MTKEKAKHLAEVLNAYAEGKTIEVFRDLIWEEVPSNGYSFDVEKESYRIKKEPTYRPFKNAEECFEEMQKHQPFGWVKNEQMKFNIVCIRPNGTVRTVINNGIYNSWYSFKDSFRLTFIDGTPFGIKD